MYGICMKMVPPPSTLSVPSTLLPLYDYVRANRARLVCVDVSRLSMIYYPSKWTWLMHGRAFSGVVHTGRNLYKTLPVVLTCVYR